MPKLVWRCGFRSSFASIYYELVAKMTRRTWLVIGKKVHYTERVAGRKYLKSFWVFLACLLDPCDQYSFRENSQVSQRFGSERNSYLNPVPTIWKTMSKLVDASSINELVKNCKYEVRGIVLHYTFIHCSLNNSYLILIKPKLITNQG